MVAPITTSRVGIDQLSLARARLGLIGFEPEAASSMAAMLAECGSMSRVLSFQAAPSATEIDSCSAVILNLAGGFAKSSWIADTTQLLTLKPPLLVVGTLEEASTFSTIVINACEVLVRPFSSIELSIRLRRCFTRGGKHDGNLRSPTPRVMIADDDPAIIALISGILRTRGIECHGVSNGRHALELTRTLLPDVLILDVNMPCGNGFEVLTALRGDPSTAAMKILMLTASDDQKNVSRGVSLGADAYICKPFQPFDFLKRLKEYLPASPVS